MAMTLRRNWLLSWMLFSTHFIWLGVQAAGYVRGSDGNKLPAPRGGGTSRLQTVFILDLDALGWT